MRCYQVLRGHLDDARRARSVDLTRLDVASDGQYFDWYAMRRVRRSAEEPAAGWVGVLLELVGWIRARKRRHLDGPRIALPGKERVEIAVCERPKSYRHCTARRSCPGAFNERSVRGRPGTLAQPTGAPPATS